MVVVRLRGVAKVNKTLAGGKIVSYWYAWRGGPRLQGRPGSPEFVAGYHEAHKARKAPTAANLAALVASYRGSPEWAKNAASTQREWNRWLDRIVIDLGTMPVEALSDTDATADLLEWRDRWSDKPRSADYAIQVLSRVLAWGKARRKIKINAAEGIEKLYQSDRADVIWTPAEVAAYRAAAPSPEAGFIVPLACLTGLRREDLARLQWSEVGELAIVRATGKSRGRKTATIPLLAETKALLKEIKARRPGAETVLTNTRGNTWTPSGLSHAVTAFKGKRLHDCRGTFATRLRLAGLTASEIADVMGWEEDRVERLLSVYVDRDATVRSLAERLSRNES